VDLNNRPILRTGAGSGIGHSLALQLAASGARFTLVGRRSEPPEEVAALVRDAGAEPHVVPADLIAPTTLPQQRSPAWSTAA